MTDTDRLGAVINALIGREGYVVVSTEQTWGTETEYWPGKDPRRERKVDCLDIRVTLRLDHEWKDFEAALDAPSKDS